MLGIDLEKIVREITQMVEKNIGMEEMLTLLRSIDKNLSRLVAVQSKVLEKMK